MRAGMNLTKVHCKHTWKCHNETPIQLIYAKKNVLKRGTLGGEEVPIVELTDGTGVLKKGLEGFPLSSAPSSSEALHVAAIVKAEVMPSPDTKPANTLVFYFSIITTVSK
jgi:hypothetical protein